MYRQDAQLGIMSLMGNSILNFVLAHPQVANFWDAYNIWAKQAESQKYPLDDPTFSTAALEFFDLNLNRNTREELLIMKSIEDRYAVRESV